LIGASSRLLIPLRILLLELMREGNVLVEGMKLQSNEKHVADFDSSARNFMIYQRPTVGSLQNVDIHHCISEYYC
jgi:hypothetical protein